LKLTHHGFIWFPADTFPQAPPASRYGGGKVSAVPQVVHFFLSTPVHFFLDIRTQMMEKRKKALEALLFFRQNNLV